MRLQGRRAPAASAPRRGCAAPVRRRAPARLEQLALELGPARPRWRFSRLVLRSPHRERIRSRLEFVRGFFPEIDGITVRVGLARKRGVLGWGSLDPDDPGIWVRPKRLDSFTVAHEFTHLLQAMKLVPHGERACDLWALARSPLVVDTAPGYLAVPAALRRRRTLPAAWSALLHHAAREALAARARGERGYLRRFERRIAEAWRRARGRSLNAVPAGAMLDAPPGGSPHP